MPPIMTQTVTKPIVYTVESILKPNIEDINITIPITTARIQRNIYKAPYTANRRYRQYRYTNKILVLIFCYFVSFDDTLSHSDFGIGGVVAGTTLMTTLIEEVPLFIQISKREFGPIWARTI